MILSLSPSHSLSSGLALSTTLVNAGVTSFAKLLEKNPRELELIVNRHPPFGNQV